MHVELLKMPVQQLTEEMKQSMLVEERYTFFQIENKLRQICTESMDAMRTRITKEADLVRKVQVMAEQAKRDVGNMEPRVEKALGTRNILDKIHHEVTNLETLVRLETEKNANQAEMVDTSLTLMEGKVQTAIQTFNTEMMRMDELKQTVKLSNAQILDYKDKLSARVDKTVEDYRIHVSELERPQAAMRKEMDKLNKQMGELVDECDARKIQQDVAD